MHRYEVQHVRSSGGSPTPLGGSYTLAFGGVATAPIPYDASAAMVKASLENLPTLEYVNVHRDVYDYGQYEWRVTFRSEVGNVC